MSYIRNANRNSFEWNTESWTLRTAHSKLNAKHSIEMGPSTFTSIWIMRTNANTLQTSRVFTAILDIIILKFSKLEIELMLFLHETRKTTLLHPLFHADIARNNKNWVLRKQVLPYIYSECITRSMQFVHSFGPWRISHMWSSKITNVQFYCSVFLPTKLFSSQFYLFLLFFYLHFSLLFSDSLNEGFTIEMNIIQKYWAQICPATIRSLEFYRDSETMRKKNKLVVFCGIFFRRRFSHKLWLFFFPLNNFL